MSTLRQRPDLRLLGMTLAIAAALLLWSTIEASLTYRQFMGVSWYQLPMLLALVLCLLPAALRADAAVDRGRPALVAYGVAVVAGTLAAALLQYPLVVATASWLAGAGGEPALLRRCHPLPVFLEYLLYAAIVVAVYANRRAARLAAERLQALQLARSHAQQRLLASRLQALQARVEPRFLFATLARVRELLGVDAARASALLDDLIVYLRHALPQMRVSGSTVTREIALVGAYLRILQRQPAGAAPRFSIQVAPGLDDAPMPPALLLPLVEWLLQAGSTVGGADIEILVTADAAALQVQLADRRATPPAAGGLETLPEEIAERLRQLLGAQLVVEAGAPASRGWSLQLTLPHGPADGDPR